jgi:peptidase C39-like protein
VTRSVFRGWIPALAVLFASTAGPSPASGQPASVRRPLLDVPYLPQTEALCGGAATAMVMRYWGVRDVYAETFAPLIERAAKGIRTDSLVSALQQRSWTAIAGPGDAEQAQQQLGRGRPVIALIEDRPQTFHYVVVVGWADGKVIVHDPARAPFRVLEEGAFERAWQQADRWMLVTLPPAGLNGTTAAPDAHAASGEASTAGPCTGLIDEGVRLANGGDRESARRALHAAGESCPHSAAAWRELAGLDALEGKWADAETNARRALVEDPRDPHAWRVIATSRYLRHDDLGALEAWNEVGEPSVDLVDVKGLERIRYRVIADAIDAPPRTLLTQQHVRRAEKRLRDIPAVAVAHVGFHPLENGRAQVDAAVVERAAAPIQPMAWFGIGLGVAIEREASTSFASLTGGGELIAASWRWWEHRPRVAFSIAAPAPRALGGGVWRVDASRETATFGPLAIAETRTRAALTLRNWLTSRVRAESSVGMERFTPTASRVAALSGGLELWPVNDRLAIDARGGVWLGSAAVDRFATTGLSMRWRSSPTNAGSVVLARAGGQLASGGSPASLWPGADTGHARDVLLRAHPLLDSGIIRGGVFGRRLVYGGTEWRRWIRPARSVVSVAPAVFVDLARATRGLASTDQRGHVDAGIGLRIALPGMGVLRLDLAHGLRDGATAFSVGFER